MRPSSSRILLLSSDISLIFDLHLATFALSEIDCLCRKYSSDARLGTSFRVDSSKFPFDRLPPKILRSDKQRIDMKGKFGRDSGIASFFRIPSFDMLKHECQPKRVWCGKGNNLNKLEFTKIGRRTKVNAIFTGGTQEARQAMS